MPVATPPGRSRVVARARALERAFALRRASDRSIRFRSESSIQDVSEVCRLTISRCSRCCRATSTSSCP
jgi:hypothetical protein